MAAGTPSNRRARWPLAALAILVPLAGLAAVDLTLRGLSWVPPDDPLLFFLESRQDRFSPFVPGPGSSRVIAPDLVNDGDGLRGVRGLRKGRQFLYPGFRPASLPAPKPEGALRIFALGGSSTYGLYVGAEAAFPARLEQRLRAALPGRSVQVVNLGCAGWASDRVANLLDAVLALEPDLVVVYAGHNEMLGGPVDWADGLPPGLRLRARLLSVSTLFAWLNHALASTLRSAEAEMIREEVAAMRVGHIPTYVPEEVPSGERPRPTAAFRDAASRRFARNAERMLATTRRAGVPLLFVLPVANLNAPPAISLHPPDFHAEAVFHAHLRAAQALQEAGRFDAALERLDRAAALSPEHALVQFRRGKLLSSAGRGEEARRTLRRAVDLDARTHRITTPLEKALLAVLLREDAPWVDPRPAFHAALDPDAARILFVDHLHPSATGHARLAELVAPEVMRLIGEDAQPRLGADGEP